MNTRRDDVRAARQHLHEDMQVLAYYYTPGQSASPRLTNVRVHSKAEADGESPVYRGGAEILSVAPRVIFMVADLDNPVRNAIVSVLAGEAYRIQVVNPPEDITITAECTRLSPTEAAAYPAPPPGT